MDDNMIYKVLTGENGPKHLFSNEGRCIRCGEDAEEWEAGCVEEIIEENHKYRSALERIADFGKVHVNSAMVRAMKQPLIDIAEEALGRTPQVPVSHDDDPISGLG